MKSLIEKKDYTRLRKILSIFQGRGWMSSQDSSTEFALALENSIIMADILTAEQFDLYCILLENYNFINYNSYVGKIEAALRKVPTPANTQHSFRIAPLLAPKDEGKNKSGPSIIYSFVNTCWRRMDHLKNNPVEGYVSLDSLRNDSPPVGNFTTVFADDFIGSGNTLLDFYDSYRPYIHARENIIFVCIAAMNAGIKKAANIGCNIYYCDLILKSITEADLFANKSHALDLINDIEDMIKVSKSFRLGYEASEALVTLQRTPNNTLPLFWETKKVGEHPWPSPFPRHLNNKIQKEPKQI